MALTTEQQTILTNEARRQELRQALASLKSKSDLLAAQQETARQVSLAAQSSYQAKLNELNTFEAGAAPGISADFGPFSTTDQALRTERFAGKAALVDFVKANPSCTEDQAVAAYTTAALTARPQNRQWLLQETSSLRLEYAQNLIDAGLVSDNTWATLTAWIVATPRDAILGL